MAIWELAPGSPWNAIFSLVMAPSISSSAICQYLAGGFEIGRGIDAAGHRVDDGDVDPHAGLQGPELLEFFLALERRGRQLDEALQRRAAIGIEADVMVAVPMRAWRRGARDGER